MLWKVPLLTVLPPAYNTYLHFGDAAPVVQMRQMSYVEPQQKFSEKQHLMAVLAPTDTSGWFHWIDE